MSTSVLTPRKVSILTQGLYDLKTTNKKKEGPATLALDKAINRVFEIAERTDPKSAFHPQQQLFYLLMKGNSVSLDSEIKSGILSQEARDGMTGDLNSYKEASRVEHERLSKPSNIPSDVNNAQAMTMLSGLYDSVSYDINEGAVPDEVHNALIDVSLGLRAYAISQDPQYPDKPYDNDFQPIAAKFYSLAQNGQMLYGRDRAISSCIMDKFEVHGTSASGNDRIYWGSDVSTTIIKDLIEGSGVVHVPHPTTPCDTRMPSLFSLSKLTDSVNGTRELATTESRIHIASALHHIKAAIETATMVDYDGNPLDPERDKNLIEAYKKNLHIGISALDLETINQSSDYSRGYEYNPTEQSRSRDAEMTY